MANDENLERTETIVESSGEELKATLKKVDDGPEHVEIEMEDENAKLASTPHDDFDWTISNKAKLNYTDAEIENYLKDYEQSLNSISQYELVEATVSSINDGNVLLDINYKSDGLISLTAVSYTHLTLPTTPYV